MRCAFHLPGLALPGLILLAVTVLASLAAGGADAAGAGGHDALPDEPLRALPDIGSAAIDPAKAALGKRLFHDSRLSPGGRTSCASCHNLLRGGADGRARAPQIDGKPGLFNTPTVYNSQFNARQSWIGRPLGVDALPLHAGAGENWDALAARTDGEVDGPAARAGLIEFLRSLRTPSRFDRHLRGDAQALNRDEKAGYASFKRYGCVACHQGLNVGGNMFARLGVMRELPGLESRPAGQGRFLVTGREQDRYMFRVPSLRNVALTAPYLHDGSVATLEEAVDLMFRHQLGRGAPPQDKAQIVQFLHTLSGDTVPPAGAAP